MLGVGRAKVIASAVIEDRQVLGTVYWLRSESRKSAQVRVLGLGSEVRHSGFAQGDVQLSASGFGCLGVSKKDTYELFLHGSSSRDLETGARGRPCAAEPIGFGRSGKWRWGTR